MDPILIPVLMVIALGYVLYLWLTTRHKERMALIESGQSANLFNKVETNNSSLKWGLVLIALGVGLAVGITLDIQYLPDNDGPIFTMPSIAIASGIGFLVYHFMVKSKTEK